MRLKAAIKAIRGHSVEQFRSALFNVAAPDFIPHWAHIAQLDQVRLHAALPPLARFTEVEHDGRVVPDETERIHVEPGPRVGPCVVEFQTRRRIKLRYSGMNGKIDPSPVC